MESLHRRADADNSYAAGYAGINSAQFYSAQTAKPTAPQPASLLNALASAATTGSLNLANSSEGTSEFAEDTSIWIGGNVNFGFRDSMNSSSLRYSTDGISIGVDRRVSNKLALGLGLGYARDKSEIGSDGTKTQATGSSLALYGSYQPTPVIYVDGLLGYGVQSFDTDRYVAVVTDFAHSRRKGAQIFGSLAAGYEHSRNGLLVSPYARLDFATERLKQASETGAGTNALTYFEQTVTMLQSSLGLRIESQHQTDFGWVQPRLRLELKHDFEKNRQAEVAYTDQLIGAPSSAPRYAMTLNAAKRHSLLMGFGSDFIFRKGMKLGIDYQTQRAFGSDRNQAIGVWLSKDLDDRAMPSVLMSSALFADPVRVEAGYTRDNNLTRARDAADKVSDRIYSLNVSKGMIFPVTDHTRTVVTGFLNGEKLHTHSGLDRYSGGAQGEFQYRTSGEFAAPTFGLFARAFYDDYYSELRTGYRYSAGITARQPLTDRIDLFGALARNVRNAKSVVFDLKDYAARFNLDYSLGQSGALYLGGEYRKGDSVTSVPASAAYSGLADVSVQDDAYLDRQLNAYRLDARTVLWTLGYNLPLGARDSIDFSVRHARSTPTGAIPATAYSGGGTRYTANQYSIAYLMRF